MDKALLKYVMKNDKREEMFHSSGYARAQSGGSMGAASTESFQKRQEIEAKRKMVRGYQNSRIMHTASLVRQGQASLGSVTQGGTNGRGGMQGGTNGRGGMQGGTGAGGGQSGAGAGTQGGASAGSRNTGAMNKPRPATIRPRPVNVPK